MSILKVDNLTKTIKNTEILKNVSFTLEEGEIVGLVGNNGAGKTSLMKVILGFTKYESGNYIIGRKSKNDNVGALIETPGLYPFLTGFDNLKLFSGSKNLHLLEDIVHKLKMENYIHTKSKSYSLGMKQKLGIAIAFLNNPNLVILDEPMNGLDPKSVRDVREYILEKARDGTAFLISSHILSELSKITDSVLIIDSGEIIKKATKEELNKEGNQDLEELLLNITEKENTHYDSIS